MGSENNCSIYYILQVNSPFELLYISLKKDSSQPQIQILRHTNFSQYILKGTQTKGQITHSSSHVNIIDWLIHSEGIVNLIIKHLYEL